MPSERLSMRRIRDLLRLKFENGLTSRVIAASLGISKGAVGEYLRRARAAGLSWPLPEEMTDTALERLLFPTAPDVTAMRPARTGLGLCRSGTAPHRGNPGAALAGIPGRASGRLWLYVVLRALRRLEAARVADHAPEPRRRREGVRRFRRRHHRRDRSLRPASCGR